MKKYMATVFPFDIGSICRIGYNIPNSSRCYIDLPCCKGGYKLWRPDYVEENHVRDLVKGWKNEGIYRVGYKDFNGMCMIVFSIQKYSVWFGINELYEGLAEQPDRDNIFYLPGKKTI